MDTSLIVAQEVETKRQKKYTTLYKAILNDFESLESISPNLSPNAQQHRMYKAANVF